MQPYPPEALSPFCIHSAVARVTVLSLMPSRLSPSRIPRCTRRRPLLPARAFPTTTTRSLPCPAVQLCGTSSALQDYTEAAQAAQHCARAQACLVIARSPPMKTQPTEPSVEEEAAVLAGAVLADAQGRSHLHPLQICAPALNRSSRPS